MINQLCAAFYWNGNDTATKGARVKWYDVCHPKNDGGLGLKDILSWNVACILHNIWLLITKAGSLWVAWIEAYILKGRSFWQVSLTQNCSWFWVEKSSTRVYRTTKWDGILEIFRSKL